MPFLSPVQQPFTPSRLVSTASLFLLLLHFGCDGEPVPIAGEQASAEAAPTPTAPARRVSDNELAMTIAELRERLGIGRAGQIRKVGGQIIAMDLRQTPVVDLSPLRGLPLRQLFLEETRVADISPLAGMPLEHLFLSHTQVTDLSPLAGAHFNELNLVGTLVTDITPLKDVEIVTLWIAQTKVTDLSPLAGKSLVSLDLQDTPVSDLAPLAGNGSLRRLHIGGTAVTDVSSLASLQLERLILSPEKITAGLDALRNMASLRGLDVELGDGSNVMSPDKFWLRYDAGEWPAKTEEAAE